MLPMFSFYFNYLNILYDHNYLIFMLIRLIMFMISFCFLLFLIVMTHFRCSLISLMLIFLLLILLEILSFDCCSCRCRFSSLFASSIGMGRFCCLFWMLLILISLPLHLGYKVILSLHRRLITELTFILLSQIFFSSHKNLVIHILSNNYE